MSEQVPAYILAGGRSSRFGSDKARAELGGTPLIVRIASALREAGCSVTVVADTKDKYRDLDLPTIADLHGGLGPMGGLQTALHHAAAAGWVLVVSCDFLLVRPGWIDALLSHRRPGAQVVAFKADRWEPLLALYHTDLLAKVSEQVAAGQGALWRLIEASASVAIDLPADWPRIAQANTPQDLAMFKT